MNNNFDIKALIVIVISSIILGMTYNYFSSDNIEWLREELKVEVLDNDSAETSEGSLKGLSLAQTIQLHSQKLAVFIDARDQWEFSEGHIPGAINIPEFSFEPNNIKLVSLDKDVLMVIYCDGDDCDTSKRLAKQIIELGYKNVFVFLGGFNEWKIAELQIEKGQIGE